MGGRGSSSGMSGVVSNFSFNVDSLSGSDKQKSWAQDIVNDAFGTINGNIRNLTTGRRAELSDAKPMADIYRNIGKEITSQLGKFTRASQVIDYRDMINPSRITTIADQMYLRDQRRNRR